MASAVVFYCLIGTGTVYPSESTWVYPTFSVRFVLLNLKLVRNDIDVNEHERLSNIIIIISLKINLFSPKYS
jgi:hypothetical protein